LGKKKLKKDISVLVLGLICIGETLVLLYVFWWSFLIGYDIFGRYLFVALLDTVNEFWFEFISLHILLVFIIYLMRRADIMNKRC